jgi:hypothetical protein
MASPHARFSPNNPSPIIIHPEVCTWYGALTFAQLEGDTNLTAQLLKRFEPLFGGEKQLIPQPLNVDATVFAAVPLELYIQTNGLFFHAPDVPFRQRRAGDMHGQAPVLWCASAWLRPPLTKADAQASQPVQTGAKRSFVCTDYTQGKVFIVSAENKIEWEYAGATNCNDLWVLPNGNLLFNTGHGVKEVARDKKIVFHYDSASEIYACQRLTNGNTFIGECNAGRLLEVNSDGQIVKELRLLPAGTNGGHAFMRNARRLDNGNYLVAHYGEQVVREYDPAGKVVREIPAAGGPHSVVRLPNGNTLVSCADGKDGSRVFEVDAGGKTVWQVQGDELPGVSLRFMAGLERLHNGDTLMANWLGHRNQFGQTADLIEVTPDKRVVWTFSGGREIKSISSALILDNAGGYAGEPNVLH